MSCLTVSEIEDYVFDIHGIAEDFEEGDILDRIHKFNFYCLELINIEDIDFEEFYLDEDYVEELVEEFREDTEYNPIVYDPEAKSVIDGFHRANALKILGLESIRGYVGYRHFKR